MKASRNSTGMIRARRLAVAGMLTIALAACATTFEPADIKETAQSVQPIEVSASRVDKDTIRPGRDIPETLSPMVIFTTEDIHGTGYRDVGRALQMLSPFVGGGR